MALAARLDARQKSARDNAKKAVATGVTVPAAPASIGATYSQTEVAALRATVDALRTALLQNGIVK